MKLYLMRHGDYQLDINQVDILTDKGKKEIRQINDFLARRYQVSHLFHSKYNRAKETAALLAAGFELGEPPRLHEGLSPNSDINLIVDELTVSQNDTVIVSHLPFLSKLASLLIMGNEEFEIIQFNPGTILCLQAEGRGRWLINWMLTPSLF